MFQHKNDRYNIFSWFQNPLFSREVRYGQFYYVDKFILLVSTNNMYLYKYQIDLSKNDVQR